VRERYEPVLPTVPDRDRHGVRAEVEAPTANERQVVVEPAPEAVLERGARADGEVVREIARQHTSVDLRKEVAESGVQVGAAGVTELRRVLCEVRLEFVLAGVCRLELFEVLSAHARRPVEPFGVARRGAGERRDGDHALGQQDARCKRVRTAPGPPPDQPTVKNRSIPSLSATAATSAAQPATEGPTARSDRA